MMGGALRRPNVQKRVRRAVGRESLLKAVGSSRQRSRTATPWRSDDQPQESQQAAVTAPEIRNASYSRREGIPTARLTLGLDVESRLVEMRDVRHVLRILHG